MCYPSIGIKEDILPYLGPFFNLVWYCVTLCHVVTALFVNPCGKIHTIKFWTKKDLKLRDLLIFYALIY